MAQQFWAKTKRNAKIATKKKKRFVFLLLCTIFVLFLAVFSMTFVFNYKFAAFFPNFIVMFTIFGKTKTMFVLFLLLFPCCCCSPFFITDQLFFFLVPILDVCCTYYWNVSISMHSILQFNKFKNSVFLFLKMNAFCWFFYLFVYLLNFVLYSFDAMSSLQFEISFSPFQLSKLLWTQNIYNEKKKNMGSETITSTAERINEWDEII